MDILDANLMRAIYPAANVDLQRLRRATTLELTDALLAILKRGEGPVIRIDVQCVL